MAQFLKSAQLADYYRVTEMDIWRGRIDAEFDSQRLAGLDGFLQLLAKLVAGNDLRGSFCQESYLLIDSH